MTSTYSSSKVTVCFFFFLFCVQKSSNHCILTTYQYQRGRIYCLSIKLVFSWMGLNFASLFPLLSPTDSCLCYSFLCYMFSHANKLNIAGHRVLLTTQALGQIQLCIIWCWKVTQWRSWRLRTNKTSQASLNLMPLNIQIPIRKRSVREVLGTRQIKLQF